MKFAADEDTVELDTLLNSLLSKTFKVRQTNITLGCLSLRKGNALDDSSTINKELPEKDQL